MYDDDLSEIKNIQAKIKPQVTLTLHKKTRESNPAVPNSVLKPIIKRTKFKKSVRWDQNVHIKPILAEEYELGESPYLAPMKEPAKGNFSEELKEFGEILTDTSPKEDQ